ncbi:MAG: hypothetical protein E3J43_06635 [Candidatus Heimdallarchaeota archaeon]|nr:MAG: hypothetical protein E3J43_06635 [Candidatus Heimdallarchaeota archaeon]
MALKDDGIVDTPIELDYAKLQTRLTIWRMVLRYSILFLAMGISITIGLVLKGDYSNYAFLVVLAIVSYELGSNGNGIKDLFDKILRK